MNIEDLRKEIDKLDRDLIKILGKRKSIILKISDLKRKKGIRIYSKLREKSILEKLETMSEKYDLNLNFLKSIFKLVLKDSKNNQNKRS